MNANEIKYILVDMLQTVFLHKVNKDVLEYIDFIDDLGMDSITFISVVVEIENAFGITVPDNAMSMDNFRNIDAIIRIIEDSKV